MEGCIHELGSPKICDLKPLVHFFHGNNVEKHFFKKMKSDEI